MMVQKNVKIRVPLKYLSNFWRCLEISLINCEINLILTLSNRYFITDNFIDYQVPTFRITDTKLYVPVVNLSIQDNAKLFEQLKSGFKIPSFEVVNRRFVLSFEDTNVRTSYKSY